MTHAPVLFFHCVDAQNLNAQSNNTKAILARWDAPDLPAAAFHFQAPDPAVSANPNVRLIKLPPNRLWKASAFAMGLGRFSGVFYPGFAPQFDNLVRRARRSFGRGGSVISTLEGLLGNVDALEAEQFRLSQLAGHRVFCQGVAPAAMASLNEVKDNSDLVIAISPFLQRMAAQMWPSLATSEIPLGVNLERFHPRGRVPYGTNPRVKVVCAGSFQPRKRPDIFLELARRHPEADFCWFGDGPMRMPLMRQVQDERIANLSLPGPVGADHLAKAFRSADFFTLPSISEGVPKVTQEAAACGLPVVCMGYYETLSVVHGITGFQAKDDTVYFDHVAKLIVDSGLRRRMGLAAAEMARSWNWDDLARRWQETICKVVLNGPSRNAA